MASYSFVSNNNIDRSSAANLLRNFLFGNSSIELYNPTNVYRRGDYVYTIDEKTGNIHVYEAQESNITGPFDKSKWVSKSATDIVLSYSDIIVQSPSEPTASTVKLWFMPIGYSIHDIPDAYVPPLGDRISIVFTGEIPIVEDTSTADLSNLVDGDIVIDWEGDGEYVSGTDTDFADVTHLYVDEQDDVLVGDNPPMNNNPAFLWVDTNLTDDV